MKKLHLAYAFAAVFALSSCSGSRENEFVPSKPDLTQEQHDKEYSAYLEQNRGWDNVAPMFAILFVLLGAMSSHGNSGGAAPPPP